MDKSNWKIVTAMRHWSAADPSSVIACEYCTAHSTYTSSLVDNNGVTQETHFHCDPHGDEAIAILEERRRAGQRWVVAERHWMHIWKVGYKPCVLCRADSRIVATRLDHEGEVISQELYCAPHAPRPTEPLQNTAGLSEVEFDLLFRFGGCYPVTADDLDGDSPESPT